MDLELPGASVFLGDCIERMKQRPAGSVQMCVTSPPYYNLRDYGVDGQIGLEGTPEQFIAKLVEVFREVRRLLADDGTCWVNIGDTYASKPNGPAGAGGHKGDAPHVAVRTANARRSSSVPDGLKHKDLIGIPWMLAFALRADGWYLRQEIIWHKPNPMPESVTDRCTKSHESLFLLSKSPQYFYDHEAVKEPAVCADSGRPSKVRGEFAGKNTLPGKEAFRAVTETRNRRSVWTIATKPYKGAHFAVFPPALVEPCILAGTSARGHCPTCSARWVRTTKRSAPINSRGGRRSVADVKLRQGASGAFSTGVYFARETTGWAPVCDCYDDQYAIAYPAARNARKREQRAAWAGRWKRVRSMPGLQEWPIAADVVLDCFNGSGTTGQVSLEHGRLYEGFELSADYLDLTRSRLAGVIEQLAAAEADRIAAAAPPPQMSLFQSTAA